MKKFLLCVALLALAVPLSFAGSKTFTFDGFCDGMTLYNNVGGPAGSYAGTHNDYDCSNSNDYVGGFKHSVKAGVGPNGATANVIDAQDGYFGYAFGEPISLQYLVVYKPSCAWNIYSNDIVFGGNGEATELLNEGTCTFGGAKRGVGARPSSLLKK